MFKKLFLIATFIAITSVIYGATVLSDDYNIPKSNSGQTPANVNLLGVDSHRIQQTATGAIAKNPSVTTSVSTNTANPCMLYGVVFSTSYTYGTDYVVFRDTFVVNTSQTPVLELQVGTATASGTSNTLILGTPIKFSNGICATQNAATYSTTILFRYLKR